MRIVVLPAAVMFAAVSSVARADSCSDLRNYVVQLDNAIAEGRAQQQPSSHMQSLYQAKTGAEKGVAAACGGGARSPGVPSLPSRGATNLQGAQQVLGGVMNIMNVFSSANGSNAPQSGISGLNTRNGGGNPNANAAALAAAHSAAHAGDVNPFTGSRPVGSQGNGNPFSGSANGSQTGNAGSDPMLPVAPQVTAPAFHFKNYDEIVRECAREPGANPSTCVAQKTADQNRAYQQWQQEADASIQRNMDYLDAVAAQRAAAARGQAAPYGMASVATPSGARVPVAGRLPNPAPERPVIPCIGDRSIPVTPPMIHCGDLPPPSVNASLDPDRVIPCLGDPNIEPTPPAIRCPGVVAAPKVAPTKAETQSKDAVPNPDRFRATSYRMSPLECSNIGGEYHKVPLKNEYYCDYDVRALPRPVEIIHLDEPRYIVPGNAPEDEARLERQEEFGCTVGIEPLVGSCK